MIGKGNDSGDQSNSNVINGKVNDIFATIDDREEKHSLQNQPLYKNSHDHIQKLKELEQNYI